MDNKLRRTVRIGLILALNNLEKEKYHLSLGLCLLFSDMLFSRYIDSETFDACIYYTRINRPKWYQKHYRFKQRKSAFYWNCGDKASRIAWLKYHIIKLSKKIKE